MKCALNIRFLILLRLPKKMGHDAIMTVRFLITLRFIRNDSLKRFIGEEGGGEPAPFLSLPQRQNVTPNEVRDLSKLSEIMQVA
jgi:hypothetical protein